MTELSVCECRIVDRLVKPYVIFIWLGVIDEIVSMLEHMYASFRCLANSILSRRLYYNS